MSLFQSIILGVIQGLTEFLPISSSGHLVMFQHFFGLKEPQLFFDISVHIGTLVTIIIFYRAELLRMIRVFFSELGLLFRRKSDFSSSYNNIEFRMIVLIVLGSIPTAIIGLLLKSSAEKLFSSVLLVGCGLLITGSVLWVEKWLKSVTVKPLSVWKALIIGTIQGIAVIPGISRSGSTIATGLFLGIEKETAAKFSFLLSIPAIFGAEILSIKDITGAMNPAYPLIGAVTAGVVGFFALKWLVYIIKVGRLHYFAPYCWLVGLAMVIWGII